MPVFAQTLCLHAGGFFELFNARVQPRGDAGSFGFGIGSLEHASVEVGIGVEARLQIVGFRRCAF
jgi:hypothetical protein